MVELSDAFVQRPATLVVPLLTEWLGRLAELVEVDRIALWEISRDGGTIVRRFMHTLQGCAPPPAVAPAEQFKWLVEQSRRGKVVNWSRMPEDVPEQAHGELEYGRRIGGKSLLSIPVATDSIIHVLSFTSVTEYRHWSRTAIRRLRLVCSILAGAVIRERAENSMQLEARRLRESEARFRGAFEHSAIGMAIIGLDGRWLQTNAANCKILGYSTAELLSMSFQELTHPDDLALNLRDFERALNGEIDHYALEKRYIHKDGHLVPGLLTVSVVRDDDGRALYFVSQLQDLTERKNVQTEIERLRIELARFGRAALTGQLTASLAHHLMQPLTAIMGNAQACSRMISDGADSSKVQVQAALEDIQRSCANAAEVIDSVRKMLRKEPGPRARIDFNSLARGVLDLMREHLALRHVSLLTNLQPDLPQVLGIPIELQQVILNLVLNAAEAVQVSDGRRAVVIETLVRDSRVELSVSDSGPGVGPDMLEKIFEPFFTTKSEGIGMGLTICADIIRAHDGNIWAEGNTAGGLTVRCQLPFAA